MTDYKGASSRPSRGAPVNPEKETNYYNTLGHWPTRVVKG